MEACIWVFQKWTVARDGYGIDYLGRGTGTRTGMGPSGLTVKGVRCCTVGSC